MAPRSHFPFGGQVIALEAFNYPLLLIPDQTHNGIKQGILCCSLVEELTGDTIENSHITS